MKQSSETLATLSTVNEAFVKPLPNSSKILGITKTFVKNQKFYQLSFSLWLYSLFLAIILCFCWFLVRFLMFYVSFGDDDFDLFEKRPFFLRW